MLKQRVADLLALGEAALLGKARDSHGRLALSFLASEAPGSSSGSLLAARLDENEAILITGLAAEARDCAASEARRPVPRSEWRKSGFKADVFAGMLIGVS